MFWYHNQTKHSYHSVRSGGNTMDWSNQPLKYKLYPIRYQRVSLNSTSKEYEFLYYIAGNSAKKQYGEMEYFLRMNPSAGALYPNELYFQVRGVEGFEDGIYHFETYSSSAVLLQKISNDTGLEPYFGYENAMRGYLFLISALYYRSSWKYHKRAFRYCLLDSGHMLGAIEMSALLKPHATTINYAIDRQKLNAVFGFDNKEWFVAGASVAVPIKEQQVESIVFELPTIEGSGTFEPNPIIEQAYQETSDFQGCTKEIRAPKFTFQTQRLRQCIFERRSQRGFNSEAITKAQFEYIIEILSQPILSDCEEELSIYIVVNKVLDMPLGLYKDGKYIKYGDFSRDAGYLSLEQYSLSSAGALSFIVTSKAKNYQAVYQKAGIIGHRLYIAVVYLGLGCSGIGAYYDDEVNLFVENEEMVLYVLAVGR